MATVVVGAGAAGLVAACFAATRGPVVVIERTADGGRKILISGGGRCNILPSVIAPERFVTASRPHLLRSLLRSWPLPEQRTFFERDVGIPLALEADTGKLFPASNRARDVRDGLVLLAQQRGARFHFATAFEALTRRGGGWRVETSRGPVDADSVVLATGGLSVPTTGSDGRGLEVAAELGHTRHDTYPALTPLTTSEARHASLSGVSLDVRLRARWRGRVTETTGGFLFTHRGYSGPAVLDLSHVPVRSQLDGRPEPATIRVAWTDKSADQWQRDLASATGLIVSAVARSLPERLARMLVETAGVPTERRATELRRTERSALIEALTAFVLPWNGDEGYRKAEVTGGGIALDDVDPRTLESRRHAGLYLCGEMLDAFGPIGGHNFAWAWATGRAAGLGAAARVQ